MKYSYQLDKAEFCRIFSTIDNFVAKLAEVGQKLMDMESAKEERRLTSAKSEANEAECRLHEAKAKASRAEAEVIVARAAERAARNERIEGHRAEAEAEAKEKDVDEAFNSVDLEESPN